MSEILFKQLNLSANVLRALEDMGFTHATEIQAQSIPLIQAGYDVVGRSQTGTGKTAAFGIPAIEKIAAGEEKRTVQVLLLCPTRELAVQAADQIKKIAKYTDGIKAVPVYGGAPIERQIMQLRQANIVIGTPGRVMDHMRRRTLKLQNLKMIILDEADEMLSMGFREDIETILAQVPQERQTILFSATMPQEIMNIIRNYQTEPQIVEINKKQVTLDAIEQFYYEVPMGRKNDMLSLLLHYHTPSRAIIFCNTKKMVDDLTEYLNSHGFRGEGIHGDMKQSQRTTAMDAFKGGRCSILVATDIAARGIDVDGIECVINYDIPQNAEYYVHRIGRTGRAGKSGRAFTICSGRRQVSQLLEIGRVTKSKMEPLPIPTPQSILEKRKFEVRKAFVHALENAEGFSYMDMVEDLAAKGYQAQQIAALALEQLYGKEETNLPEIAAREKKRFSKEDFVKLVINVGRSSRMAPNFIVGAIAERTSLSGKDIGKIEIYDDETVVEVPKSAEQSVLEAMEGCKINGVQTETRPLASQPSGGYKASGEKKAKWKDYLPKGRFERFEKNSRQGKEAEKAGHHRAKAPKGESSDFRRKGKKEGGKKQGKPSGFYHKAPKKRG